MVYGGGKMVDMMESEDDNVFSLTTALPLHTRRIWSVHTLCQDSQQQYQPHFPSYPPFYYSTFLPKPRDILDVLYIALYSISSDPTLPHVVYVGGVWLARLDS